LKRIRNPVVLRGGPVAETDLEVRPNPVVAVRGPVDEIAGLGGPVRRIELVGKPFSSKALSLLSDHFK
jgi:hypothetical protein